MDLLLGGVEGQIADVESCRVAELVLEIGRFFALAGGVRARFVGVALALFVLLNVLALLTEVVVEEVVLGEADFAHGVGAWLVEAVNCIANLEVRHSGLCVRVVLCE